MTYGIILLVVGILLMAVAATQTRVEGAMLAAIVLGLGASIFGAVEIGKIIDCTWDLAVVCALIFDVIAFIVGYTIHDLSK